ncbi:uncharacterized protein LOC110461804 [Mizuhopecten yessoensis]|uniref:Uncharacterized protein n=1 Tax=Mizuhopecten yessoensis TaxID=6573 RepID=A0A210PZQ3_MIZYE|nr:uncharacterized protein LOC110461804 [Mizuhopecten yessoensis]OWF41889.1 hypothetical protein KP79_PYT04640 [Mizuhopecten yessoensis]
MNNATTNITSSTYNSGSNRQRNTYMLIGFSFISLLMIGIFLAFVHRKCRKSSSSAKQWCLSCCSRQPENRCPSVSRTEEVTGTEQATAQVKPEPEHLYENIAFTDDDGKITKEVIVKEKCVNFRSEMPQCSGFCDTEDDSGISDVCTSPRCSESNSSIDTRYFAYDKNNGLHVYYNDGFDNHNESRGIIRVLMPENLDTGYIQQKRNKNAHVYENINKDQHTYVNVANKRSMSPARSQQKQQKQQHYMQQQRRFRESDAGEHSMRIRHPDVYTIQPKYNTDPNYENLKPEKRLEHLRSDSVYYVNDHSTDRALEALGNSFRRSQRKWQQNSLSHDVSSPSNTYIDISGKESPPSKARHMRGFYRNSPGRRYTGPRRLYNNSSSESSPLPTSQVREREKRLVTQYVKAADGTLRAITLHM